MGYFMDNAEKSSEELLYDLTELQKSYNSSIEIYEKEISELRQKIDELNKSELKYRLAYMTSPNSININRLSDGMYVSINEGFTNILGYTEKESIGRTSLEMNIWLDPDDRVRMVNEVKISGKVENFEANFLSKDGRVVYGILSATLIDLEGVPHILTVVRDISVRRKAEEALAKEQFLIDALMNNLTDHVYFKDTESKFIRNNKAHALSFGFEDPGQLIGKSDFDFFAEQAAREAYNDEQQIIKTGEPILKEERLTRKDGTVAWFSAMKLPLRDNTGKTIGTFGISRDITEWKKTEEALKQSEERFRSLTQYANDAIITSDQSGTILGWNKGAEKIFGYPEHEILGKSLNILVPPEYLAIHNHSILGADKEASQRVLGKTLELHGLKKDGSVIAIELSVSEWEASAGHFFTGFIRDITGRKRTELENQILYEITRGVTATSNLDDLLKLIHHSLSKVVYAENIFVALYNQKTELFSFPYFIDKIDETPCPTSMKKSCSAFVFRTVRPLLLTQEIFDELAEKGEVELVGSNSPSWIGVPLQTPSKVIGVLVLQHYEKENVYSEGDVRFLTSIGSQIALAIERKKTEEEIKLKNELLQSVNAEKDKFFSIIAHDLRGPLSAFVAATQIITEEVQAMSIEEIRDITESMKTSATNIYSLLENLLEWSRLRRDTMDFFPERLNLRKKTEACIDVLIESAKRKGIILEVVIPDELDVLADSHMFETVIRNFVSNAIKFTSSGGKVTITASFADTQSIVIKIIDTGIGMSSELKDKLFRINEKSSRPGTAGEPSTGLGLLLCKEFIEKHHGRIWVESEPGKGSTFSFSIKPAENIES
jgi:PAS domain S-box-containing protein